MSDWPKAWPRPDSVSMLPMEDLDFWQDHMNGCINQRKRQIDQINKEIAEAVTLRSAIILERRRRS